MVEAGPYEIDKRSGLWHIRLKGRGNECVACVRADAALIIMEITRQETLAEVSALLARKEIKG